MVVFTCLNCNASLKRVLVEKHYTTVCRRNTPNLTCIDCLKDFNGDNYMSHITCISEAERYGDKNFKAKPAGVSQNEWIDIVHLCAKKNTNPRFRIIFEVLSSYSNVPRKREKFMNFIKNSSSRSITLANDVFDIIEKEFKNQKKIVSNGVDLKEETKNIKKNNGECVKVSDCPPLKGCKRKKSLKDQLRLLPQNILNDLNAGNFNAFFNISGLKNVADDGHEESRENVPGVLPTADENSEKLNKNNFEKDLIGASNVDECAEFINKKKRRKRKTSNGESAADTGKRPKVEIKDNIQYEDKINYGNDVESSKETKTKNVRFNWQEVIREILRTSPNNELTIKRIEKKTLSVYRVVKGDKTRHEKLISKFNKNLKRTYGVLVENDIAKLSADAHDE